MFGAKITLIVLTSQRLARIDLAGPARRLRVERALSCPAIASSELAAAVAIAYRLGESHSRRPGLLPWQGGQRSIVVLSDDIWNDSITLPLDVTVLLRTDEELQALALEAENYSGISAFNSRMTVRKLVDASSNLVDVSSNGFPSSTWWVAQVAKSDLLSMNSAAQVCGANFLGASHVLAPWRATVTRPAMSCDLADAASLNTLGEHWAQSLSTVGRDLLVRPEKEHRPRNASGWLQASAAMVTAAACAGLFQLRTQELKTATALVLQLQQQLADYEAVAKKVRTTEAQLQTSRKMVTPAASRPSPALLVQTPSLATVNDNARWLTIFEALIAHTPEECWIESWNASNGQANLNGRALVPQAVHDLASRLDQSLVGHGWQVLPPVIHPKENELFKFELPVQFREQHSSAARQPQVHREQPATQSGAWQ